MAVDADARPHCHVARVDHPAVACPPPARACRDACAASVLFQVRTVCSASQPRAAPWQASQPTPSARKRPCRPPRLLGDRGVAGQAALVAIGLGVGRGIQVVEIPQDLLRFGRIKHGVGLRMFVLLHPDRVRAVPFSPLPVVLRGVGASVAGRRGTRPDAQIAAGLRHGSAAPRRRRRRDLLLPQGKGFRPDERQRGRQTIATSNGCADQHFSLHR